MDSAHSAIRRRRLGEELARVDQSGALVPGVVGRQVRVAERGGGAAASSQRSGDGIQPKCADRQDADMVASLISAFAATAGNLGHSIQKHPSCAMFFAVRELFEGLKCSVEQGLYLLGGKNPFPHKASDQSVGQGLADQGEGFGFSISHRGPPCSPKYSTVLPR